MTHATAKDEVATAIQRTQWIHKLSGDVVAKFLETIIYVDGHLAHMEHVEIEKSLDKREFAEFLHLVGTDEDKFRKFAPMFCAGQIAYRYCSPGGGILAALRQSLTG
jgi:hypothetical protein